ncbi:MAG: response regulator transcription factor, partial [Myxococcota bacterium]
MNEHTVEIRSELEKLEQRMRSAISEGDNYAALRDVAHTLGRILRPEEMNQPQAGASERITVVVADDHAALRESIAARLAAEMDIDVVATVGDYQATMEALENQAPDIILLDLSMPGGSGVDFIRRVLTAGYETRFVVLTM